jgi:hypothetical protein
MWESSRMILHEHRNAMIAQNRELRRNVRPNIDFDEAEEIAAEVAKSFADQTEITIKIYDPFNERQETGTVEKIDQFGRRIYIAGEWVKFDEIIGLQ